MSTVLHDYSPPKQKSRLVSKAAEHKAISPAASAHLDLIRGLAAIAVLIGHGRNIFLLDFSQIHHHNLALTAFYFLTLFGHQAVMVFFVLSGLLVGSSVIRTVSDNKWSTARYCLHRLVRLEIVLLPALILGLLWDWSGIHAFGLGGIYGGHTQSYIMNFNVPANISPRIFLGNLAFQQSLHVPCLGSNIPLWSLSNEFWYYVLFPCVALFFSARVSGKKRILILIFALMAARLMGLSLLDYFPVWLLGVGVFYLPAPPISPFYTKALLYGTMFLFALSLLLSKVYWKNEYVFDYSVAVCFASLLYSLLHQKHSVSQAYAKFSKLLASSSFTLYVVHLPLLVFISAWIGHRWTPSALHLTFLLGIFLGTWIYARIIYMVFESNTNRVRSRVEGKLLPVVPRLPVTQR